MDNLDTFMRWWREQRADNTAYYAHPQTFVEGAEAKSYKALLRRIQGERPRIEKSLFERLSTTRLELEQSVAAGAKELAHWWESSFIPSFPRKAHDLLKHVRQDPVTLEVIMRDPNNPMGPHGVFSQDSVECYVVKDQGERHFGKRSRLRKGVEAWMAECLTWLQEFVETPLAAPPFLLCARPVPAWGGAFGLDLPDYDQSPFRQLPVRGLFSTPAGKEPSDSSYWSNPTNPGSREIYRVILQNTLFWMFNERPTSCDSASAQVETNPWTFAQLLTLFLEESDPYGMGDFWKWLDQVHPVWDAWIKSRMGSLLVPTTPEGAHPAFKQYYNQPGLRTTAARAVKGYAAVRGNESHPETDNVQAAGVMITFLLDHFVDELPVNRGTLSNATLATVKKRQEGKRGQLLDLCRQYPDLNRKQIAELMGLRSETLSRPHYQVWWNEAEAMNKQRDIPKGSKSAEGDLEAVAPDD